VDRRRPRRTFTAADLTAARRHDRQGELRARRRQIVRDGKLWGAPTSFGNQLMLLWDKTQLGDTPPADSDAWVAKAKELTTGGNYGIVFNQTESFWLVPFLGGFNGSVFAEDGVTPTLDTDAMKARPVHVRPVTKVSEADYNVPTGSSRQGPFIINGD
jgi:arabinogalactan oligomer/maltooligosaccharide transport system substrate-binding protein